jgi:hypothetical protein
MTTITELETLTIEQTKRPELVDITRSAIRTATLRAHHVDFFPRDLSEAVLDYVPGNKAFYDFQNIGDTVTLLRSFKHVQSVDSVTGAPLERMEYRELDDLYDSCGNLRPSIYTLQGETLRIYPQAASGRVVVYYYRNPNTQGFAYRSWIADQYPDELAMWAASIVFARTGFTEMANDFIRQQVVPFQQMLVESHLLGNVN